MAAFACTLLVAPAAVAHDYPVRPIRILVSFAPGGLTDTIARALQPRLQEGFGQPILIENKPGAGGTVAEGLLAKSPADGYTILLSADSVPANPHLIPNLSYDSFKDLQPVSLLARIPLVLLVNNTVPAGTVKDFVAWAKKNDKAGYASPGVGTSNHLYFEVFKDMTGIELPHLAYKGGGPAMTDLVGGQVLMAAETVPAALQQIRAGKVRALAVTTPQRISMLPEIPTVAETGWKDFDVVSTFGGMAPAGTPPEVLARLNAEIGKIMQDPAAKEQFLTQGVYALPPQTPAEASARLKAEVAKWAKVIDETGVKADE